MGIRWTADSTVITADQTEPTADAAGAQQAEAPPGSHPKFIGGGAGGDGRVFFPGVSLEAKPLRGPKRVRARITIDPSPIPIPTVAR